METKPKTYHSLVFNYVEVDLSREENVTKNGSLCNRNVVPKMRK